LSCGSPFFPLSLAVFWREFFRFIGLYVVCAALTFLLSFEKVIDTAASTYAQEWSTFPAVFRLARTVFPVQVPFF